MKTSLSSVQSIRSGLRLAAICGLVAIGGNLSGWAQTASAELALPNTASNGVSVITVNGQTVVTLNGKQVYGPLKGKASSRSRTVNGIEYSVVYDDDKVVWESAPGAAKQLESAVADTTGISGAPDQQQLQEQQRKAKEKAEAEQQRLLGARGIGNPLLNGAGSLSPGGGSSWSSSSSGSSQNGGPGNIGGYSSSQSGSASISTKTENGTTVVVYKGQEIPAGTTKGTVSAKARTVNGKEYAAAFDGDHVIWENTPGAADHLK